MRDGSDPFAGVALGARGGIRTHTPFRTEDFESSASAIPPPGPVARSQDIASRSKGPLDLRARVGQHAAMDATDAALSSAKTRRITTILAVALLVYALRTWMINRNEQRYGPPPSG